MKNKTHSIYLDHAATTYLDDRVKKSMDAYWTLNFGNPSSLHEIGRNARCSVERARREVASMLNARPEEIIFTGSGTESDNLAILGIAERYRSKGKHIITSAIEHPAVLESCKVLEKKGFRVTYVPVNARGLVSPKDIEAAVSEETILVSIMYANNEIGTIQPIQKISELLKKRKSSDAPIFHTDACQAAGMLDLDVQKLGVDAMTLNGGKIYGPKGIGALFCKKNVFVKPQIVGGHQESSRRAGTENVANIVGFAKALQIAQHERIKENERLKKLRNYCINEVLSAIPKSRLNGDPIQRLPNNVHISFQGVEGESMLLLLDKERIYISTGSACSSGDLRPSHVLLAIGLTYEDAHGSIRITLGKRNSKTQIDYAVQKLSAIVKKLRAMSPMQ